jgi:hypothetical protein
MRRTMFLPGPRGSIMAPSYLRNMGRVGCEMQHQHHAVVEQIRLPFRLFRRQCQVKVNSSSINSYNSLYSRILEFLSSYPVSV